MRNASRGALAALILSAFLPLIITCETPEDVQLTFDMRRQIDTLSAAERQRLAPVYDSLCVVWTDSFVRMFYDSILEERLRQMQKLREVQ